MNAPTTCTQTDAESQVRTLEMSTSNIHKLTPELISLVHHIELDKAGWWDLSLQRLILTALWLKRSDIALTPADIAAVLNEQFDIALATPPIEKQLHFLVVRNEVLPLPDGRYKLCEATLQSCEKELNDAIDLERAVREQFDRLLVKHCPEVDKNRAWEAFSSKFLLPLVQELGANTYKLLIGERMELEFPQTKQFTACFEASEPVRLQAFIRAFLDPSSSMIRRYVLRTLNAYFVVQATGLNEETVQQLAHSSQHKSAVLFFDTNVLFSLLGLHENPADEGSLALLGLVKQLSSSVPIRLRVLPPTLDEMRRAITASQEAVINLRISPRLVDSAIQAGISGITEKFLRLSASRGGTVTPADYFEPYIKNLLTILRGNGVDLYSEDLNRYKKDQGVIDDLLLQLEFEKKKFGEKAKNYERLEHDMTLWHFVKDKRPLKAESPLEAEYWVVTADYRFLGFDNYKQNKMDTEIPICLHPATLTQLLQFWVPRTPELEEALLKTMRLPTVLTLDSDAEQISLRILNALSTFENIGDLPTETTTRVLLNEALRQKITIEHNVSKQVELVREALIEENRKAEQRTEEARVRVQQLQASADLTQIQLTAARNEVNGLRSELEQQKHESIRSKAEAAEAEKKFALFIEERRRTRSRATFGLFCFLFAALLVLSSWAIIHHFHLGARWSLSLTFIDAILWLSLTHWIGHKAGDVRGWPIFDKFLGFKSWIYSTVLTGLFICLLWDFIRAIWR